MALFRARPKGRSPCVSLRDGDLSEVEHGLDTTGHVVLDGVWNSRYLARLCERAERWFAREDATYSGKFSQFPRAAIDKYLNGCASVEECVLDPGRRLDLGRPEVEDELFDEFERSGLPALYRYLLRGDFVAARVERSIRRADPRFPLRFDGVHCDGQLTACSSHGLQSKRELTLWTPLVDCVSRDTPRLLLLHRGHTPHIFRESEKVDMKGVVEQPILLQPHQIAEDDPAAAGLPAVMERQYARLFSTVRCYAPPVPIGSAVLFDREIWHGSYFVRGMKKTRFSLDLRCLGEYEVVDANQPYTGTIYRRGEYP
jgi:hypothetical protein